jgi:hypothetical protein
LRNPRFLQNHAGAREEEEEEEEEEEPFTWFE